jgi:hypothetical protein
MSVTCNLQLGLTKRQIGKLRSFLISKKFKNVNDSMHISLMYFNGPSALVCDENFYNILVKKVAHLFHTFCLYEFDSSVTQGVPDETCRSPYAMFRYHKVETLGESNVLTFKLNKYLKKLHQLIHEKVFVSALEEYTGEAVTYKKVDNEIPKKNVIGTYVYDWGNGTQVTADRYEEIKYHVSFAWFKSNLSGLNLDKHDYRNNFVLVSHKNEIMYSLRHCGQNRFETVNKKITVHIREKEDGKITYGSQILRPINKRNPNSHYIYYKRHKNGKYQAMKNGPSDMSNVLFIKVKRDKRF